MYKAYELNLIESDCFDSQILLPMYEDAKEQYPIEAQKILDDYKSQAIFRPEAYEQMKQLLKKRKFN